MHTTRLIPSLRRGAALALACLLAPAGFGQTAPTPSTSSAASSAAVQKLDTFEVTGTRIQGLFQQADFSPTFTIDRLEIEQSGLTSMGEIARLIPQAFSQGSYEGMGFGGQSQGQGTVSDGSTASVLTQRTNINLRGLGAASTLVLLNGQRLARSGNIRGSDGYDLTGIPVSAIERVEVLTDGASALYGSDAIGGVVNIITRKNYSGTELTFSYENTFDSDTAVRGVSFTHGLARGPLALTLTGTYQKRNGFAAVDRYFSATDDWRSLGGTSTFASYGAGGFAMGAGVVQAVTGNLPGVSPASQYAVIPTGATGTGLTAGQFVATTVSADLGDRAKFVNLISPQFSRSVGFRGSYALRANFELYASGTYSETRTHIEGMPVNFRNSMVVPADYPGNPFGVQVRLNKTFWELPANLQGEKFTTNSNLGFTAGGRGKLAHDWRYDAGVSWNRARLINENAFDPVLETTNFNNAVAARQLVFFYDSRAQKPNDLNLLKSLLRPGNANDTTDTTVWSVSANGPVWQLPAGPIGVAVGAEYTTEDIKTGQSIPDLPTINLSLLGNFQRTLTSGYVETRIPVVAAKQQVPLISRLELSGAARYDRYSDAGGDSSPGFGVQYRPLSWLGFRATRNHSFRAPSIQALYRPVTQSTNTNPAGFIDRQRNELVSGVIQTRIGGNLDLKPEKAVSENIGIVLEIPHRWFKGLSVSIDAQRLTYNDRISSLSTLQEWADLFPERLIRDTTGTQPGRVIGIDTRSTNINRQELETTDYQVSYSRRTGIGSFTGRLGATEYRKVEAYRIPGAPPVSSLHSFPTRVTWMTYWMKGPWSAGVSGFYQENSWVTANLNANPPVLPFSVTQFASVIEWNTQFSYDFGYKTPERIMAMVTRPSSWSQWLLADTKLAVTVNNVFDREPPHRQGNAGFGVTDPRMRRYSLTLRKKL